ncbi:MAG: molybdopterin-guanine dinucleotide biosynthesis protein B [Rhizobiaceae bacterium]|nr:molybdopterin-guanine dinucleotide biosynthesis protein B [Rhizobiaceae bacterium]
MPKNTTATPPPVFGISGWKNSGKTTLVQRLIEEFTSRGLIVSAIKHAHHSFDIDHENRDSYKFRMAGARRTAIVSRNRWAMIHELREEDEPPLEEILQHIGSCDLVLVEGYKRHPIPKIEVRNTANNDEILSANDPNIIAVVFQAGAEEIKGEKLPAFDANDIKNIADFIAKQIL